MKNFDLSFWLLVISSFLIILLIFYIMRQKEKKQLHKIFLLNLACTLIISVGVLSQSIFNYFFSVPAIWFENFIYIGTCFLPVSIFFTSLIFVQTKIKFKKRYILLFIIPILSLIILWTNDFHHLFYIKYSYSLQDIIYGPYFYIHIAYTYMLLFIAIIKLLAFSVKNSGIFSKQSILVAIGLLCPIFVNIFGALLNVFTITVFVTPISFSISVICIFLAIFKFDFLSITPIALQKIVDRMSDSYLVLNEDNVITDFNKPFLTTFKLKDSDVRNINIFDLLKISNETLVNEDVLKKAIIEVKNSSKTISYDKKFDKYDKYFHIEINTITSETDFLGTLILFKDTTQHIKDMETIKNNQDMLMERERLASLGQLIGGIAHNLKTPIMSIAGADEGLSDLVKELDASIGNPVVNDDDFHAIAKDMNDWIEKIKSYTSYMSDILTAVKGQAVTFSEQENENFTVSELFKRVDILMKHELKQAFVYLNISLKIPENTLIYGNVNSLVQVINNMISNSIQAYNGKPDQKIELIAQKDDNKHIIISVKDYGPGLPDVVKEKLFNEMVTTKGKNGTGLGLYMSYSTIKAHFNGDIEVKTSKNGTTFNIILPSL